MYQYKKYSNESNAIAKSVLFIPDMVHVKWSLENVHPLCSVFGARY